MKVPGRRPESLKEPSGPAIAPVMMVVCPLMRSETEARGIGWPVSPSTTLPLISNWGWFAGA